MEGSIKIKEIKTLLNMNNENKMVISSGNCLIFIEFPSNYTENVMDSDDPNTYVLEVHNIYIYVYIYIIYIYT
jgi:hypothetical protein